MMLSRQLASALVKTYCEVFKRCPSICPSIYPSLQLHCCRLCISNTSHISRRLSCSTNQINGLLEVSDEISSALHDGKPVVALESTIITHGMPYPENVNTALEVETIVRENGAVPATIAVLDGKIHVGVTADQLEWLGSRSSGLYKISRRDFPVVLSKAGSGGTTVSGTMVVAHKMDIPIFVTGGIGGVHRGVDATMDISADLTELGRTPVAVVSAGIKSILDIGKTLEYLETQGVCVSTLGPTGDFPAFFSPVSGFKSPHQLESVKDAAKMIDSWARMCLQSGILIAVPIPEAFAATGEGIEAAIISATEEARAKNVTGRDVTPFILSKVNEQTKGASLHANIALVKNNAAVGSQIAVELNRIKGGNSGGALFNTQRRCYSASSRPVVIGGTIVDFYAQFNADKVEMNGATYPGSVRQSFGGVGRNIADGLSRLNANPLFISAVGCDSHLESFQDYCSHMDLSGVTVLDGHSTATYCCVLQRSGEVMYGIGDMMIHQEITPQLVSQFSEAIVSAPLVCMDGNISLATIEYICELCFKHDVPVWFEPTDVYKATKPFETRTAYTQLTYTSPNIRELHQMWLKHRGFTDSQLPDLSSRDRLIEFCHDCVLDLLPTIPVIVVTLGRHGVLLCECLSSSKTRSDRNNVAIKHYPACELSHNSIVSVSGAGDCLAAAMIYNIIQGHDLDLCVRAGLLAAQHSLQSHHAVPASIIQSREMSEKYTFPSGKKNKL
ncbi:pseudouridine-metabolizing bifunctional protein C1861.05-like [Gigantopelta aegis]|uniref:pseudouridine-metabolizing bifunctional protein C1861.05-like n=1 Tax=Gigantopelta aegis TaxID=1735272 RepID=UPI001B8895A5|nr:pseudouridine-metabolizing bifunctional protein C1861.05-like [Gigantopelta aegis]XP_041361197.1 pseudouridine-metabolizing bifunctional protein C1861.05-like [Gigantopelta aegis]